MKRNWKFHAIAIGAICAIITLLFFLIGPQKPVAQNATQQIGDRYVQIYSATWGVNCNEYIELLNEQKRQEQIRTHSTQPIKTYTRVSPDNGLTQLSSLCNGKLICDFDATTEALGGDQLTSCSKRLVVGYRCYTYDKMHQFTAPQGEHVKIDCRTD